MRKRLSDILGELQESSSGGGYEFADKKPPDQGILRVAACRWVDMLAEYKRLSAGGSSYSDLRFRYIACNRALNFLGEIAPRFRPSIHAGGKWKGARTPEENLLSNDHQVIDLEWLALNCGYDGQRSDHLPARWSGLFLDCLDLEIASRFAGTAGTAENKARNILALTMEEQIQLRSIQSEEVRSWWREREEERRKVRRVIIDSQAREPKLRGCEDSWPNAYLAVKCAEKSGGAATDWIELISGEAVAASTLSHVKKRVPQLLKGAP